MFQSQNVRKPFALLIWEDKGFERREFGSFDELAKAVYRYCAYSEYARDGHLAYGYASHAFAGWREGPGLRLELCWEQSIEIARAGGVRHVRRPRCTIVQAVSPNGKPMSLRELYAAGESCARERRASRRYQFWDGLGPVPGTRKHRGGYRYFRRPQTIGLRAGAAGAADARCEEGLEALSEAMLRKIDARPSRNARNLPNSWDDIGRCIQRSWKEHGGKRGKQWDRAGAGGNPRRFWESEPSEDGCCAFGLSA